MEIGQKVKLEHNGRIVEGVVVAKNGKRITVSYIDDYDSCLITIDEDKVWE